MREVMVSAGGYRRSVNLALEGCLEHMIVEFDLSKRFWFVRMQAPIKVTQIDYAVIMVISSCDIIHRREELLISSWAFQCSHSQWQYGPYASTCFGLLFGESFVLNTQNTDSKTFSSYCSIWGPLPLNELRSQNLTNFTFWSSWCDMWSRLSHYRQTKLIYRFS